MILYQLVCGYPPFEGAPQFLQPVLSACGNTQIGWLAKLAQVHPSPTLQSAFKTWFGVTRDTRGTHAYQAKRATARDGPLSSVLCTLGDGNVAIAASATARLMFPKKQWANVSENLMDLLKQHMLNRHPSKRYSAAQVRAITAA